MRVFRFLAASLFASGAVIPAFGDAPSFPCSLATLSGGYGLQKSGKITGGFVSAVGVVRFDGAGGVSGRQTISTNGALSRETIDATYTVNDDCTGTITSAAGESMKIMVDHSGDEVFGMLLTPGTNEAVSFERIADHAGHEQPCALDTFNGAYGFQRIGHVPAGDLLAVGFTVFDGVGNFCCGGQTIDRNGSFSFGTNPGTYSIEPDCMGAQYDATGAQFGEFVLVRGGLEAFGLSESAGNNVVAHFSRVADRPGNDPGEPHP